jgi:hypothetical protein
MTGVGQEPQTGVVVIVSRPAPGDGEGRRFAPDPSSDPAVVLSLEELRHEEQLVGMMTGMGWKLTMVGGGSRGDEVRRFYFRRI